MAKQIEITKECEINGKKQEVGKIVSVSTSIYERLVNTEKAAKLANSAKALKPKKEE